MCDSCGCCHPEQPITLTCPESPTSDDPRHARGRTIVMEQDILAKNNRISRENRLFFKKHAVLALNLVSSPGSGKTTLLEKTILKLAGHTPAVIEGDQQTLRDAERIAATGAPVIQVNTGQGCHLDAAMIQRASRELPIKDHSILFIENVGNLVCPAMFDLGEALKVVIISVTEGDDKPQKYPAMFQAARLCIINKIDLLPHVDFELKRCRKLAARVNPALEFIELSATTGQGLEGWLDWLEQRISQI